MKVSSLTAQGTHSYALDKGVEIGIPIQRMNSVSSFGIKGASYIDYEDGEFIGNMSKGGACNLETIEFTAHGNGTHTECIGHVVNKQYYVNDHIADNFYPACLISLHSKKIGKGLYLDFDNLLDQWDTENKALVIRSLPNDTTKTHRDYSGIETPCIHPEDMKKVLSLGIDHLLLDLPSVDPEWDGGALASHHIFWNTAGTYRMHASITEFIFVPQDAEDGHYLLKLNISPFISDAAPSRPVLYPKI